MTNPLLTIVVLAAGLLTGFGSRVSAATKAQPGESPRFFYKGALMSDTTIPGEQKKDNAQPSNAVGWQLSRDRFIWIYVITTFQGADSVRAIAYQIRRDAPDGPLIREAILSKAINDWDPYNKGESFFKQQGHGKVFGVPKGAVDRNGKLLTAQNVFCAMWYEVPRPIDRKTGLLILHRDATAGNAQGNHEHQTRIGSIQFKLNDANDDIVFLAPHTQLREKGYETGEVFCSLGSKVTGVNHWYTPLAPHDESFTQWVDVRHFYPGGVAPVMMEFNRSKRLYEWVKTGRLVSLEKGALIECFVNKLGDEWIVGARGFRERDAARSGTETIWFRTTDLFGAKGLGQPILTPPPGPPHANRSGYVCGDGVLRIFGGNDITSPFKWARDPQYCWDVDPVTFALSNCKTVLSSADLGIESRGTKFRAFLSPVFQNQQLLTITVSRELRGPPAKEELEKFGVHYWAVSYDRDVEDAWRFAK